MTLRINVDKRQPPTLTGRGMVNLILKFDLNDNFGARGIDKVE